MIYLMVPFPVTLADP